MDKNVSREEASRSAGDGRLPQSTTAAAFIFKGAVDCQFLACTLRFICTGHFASPAIGTPVISNRRQSSYHMPYLHTVSCSAAACQRVSKASATLAVPCSAVHCSAEQHKKAVGRPRFCFCFHRALRLLHGAVVFGAGSARDSDGGKPHEVHPGKNQGKAPQLPTPRRYTLCDAHSVMCSRGCGAGRIDSFAMHIATCGVFLRRTGTHVAGRAYLRCSAQYLLLKGFATQAESSVKYLSLHTYGVVLNICC